MFRMRTTRSATVLATVCTGLGIALAVPHVAQDTVCQYQPKFEFNASLPASHVRNQCTEEQVGQVSWLSWVSGGSQSYQFHFLDLLELLSRDADERDLASPSGQ